MTAWSDQVALVTGGARGIGRASGWITAQMLIVDGGRMDYIGHG
jgi:NADP-dependent 3-hydroxy acid dehydrogenase YdfG